MESESNNEVNGGRDLNPRSRTATYYLQKFRLYETQSNFYMIGRDKTRTLWRVLKIGRTESSELNILEDPTSYSESECFELLRRIHEGNQSTGGLKFVMKCYGIIGFIKFLGPYYMLVITNRRRIGAICGHDIYEITKSEIIELPHSSLRYSITNSKDENRYKKLLCTVDLTKDFFFSYSYHVMRCLQKNFSNDETEDPPYETMFVWNEFLTHGIRQSLKNTLWTVALVYGFFKQARLSISGKNFKLTLIARRSRHYAGTRYLKRGVNEKGRVANDVETEQILFEDIPEGCPTKITSVVQNRGSIPLFWSQETSRLNLKPDIILQNKDSKYEATQLHFDNLVKRYGNPIIVLNLIKAHEKKPRESILRTEFANAIDSINRDLPEENRLKFLHWDLHKLARSKATNVLSLLGKVAANALGLTGFFYCQVLPTMKLEEAQKAEILEDDIGDDAIQCDYTTGDTDTFEEGSRQVNDSVNDEFLVKPPLFQKGVLRTNCIDCLDRTNVAQYAYGLAALGHQLHALGYIDFPKIDLDTSLADDLMRLYEMMGDILALQYGGSAAHNKIFSERRGQWRAATQSQELFRTLQRYYSNAYMDAEKQDAINVFLGYFMPQEGKPAIWELGSDQNLSTEKRGLNLSGNARLLFKRSLSDGNILRENCTPVERTNIGQVKLPRSALAKQMLQQEVDKVPSDFCPEVTTCEGDLSRSRCAKLNSISSRRLPVDTQKDQYFENDHIYLSDDGAGDSNFLDLDWISSAGNSFDEDIYDRSGIFNSPMVLSSENVTKQPSERNLFSKDRCFSKIQHQLLTSQIHLVRLV